jgi:ubiquinone/menaquinone biosynthesis C-methylase UbiE
MAQKIGDDYVLAVGEADRERLDVLQTVYGPYCLKTLKGLKIPLGSQCADIGCGTGTMTRDIAALVGSRGHVDAIDISTEQIELARNARQLPEAAKLNFTKGSVYELKLSPNTYDFVFSRFLICHLEQREKALSNMVALLKPGGKLLVVDIDFHTIYTIPPTQIYEEYSAYARKRQKIIATDYEVGPKLATMLKGCGLKNITVELAQPIFCKGPEKRLWQNTFKSGWPSFLEHGLATQAQLENLYERMENFSKDPDTWVAHVRVNLVSGEK